MSRPAIGQAVVTDPSSGRSSGYVLVAASPSVRPEDARHLTAAPQVTDHLHLEKSPGPYFSFYRLPSGSWAAVKRFVRGTRRGAFNRVVVHTLVIPPAALGDFGGEPWLLWTRCRFRTPGGAELTPASLTERVGDPALDELDDLEVSTEEEPRAERAALLGRRRDFLRGRWGGEELEEKLRAVLSALAGGRRALLPQGAESEQLLAVAWSLLPPEDRLETPWTTHLAPAAGNLFRLANGPDPRALRDEQGGPDGWVLPLAEEVPDDAGEDGRTLALSFVAGNVDLGALDEGFELHRIRLSASGRTRRWIVWVQSGGSLFTQQASRGDGASVEELARLFHGLRRLPRETLPDPWLRPAHLLRLVCAAALRLRREGKTADEAVAQVLQVLVDSHWHGALLSPEVVAELAGLSPGGPETAAVAAALVRRVLPRPPGGRREREALLDLFAAAPPLADPRSLPVSTPVLVDLGVDLAAADSPRAAEAFRRLAALPGGLAAALESRPSALADAFEAVADGLRRAVARKRTDDSHRALVELTSPGAGAHPEKAVAVLAKLGELAAPELLAWAQAVARVAAALDASAPEAASRLRANYWQALAAHGGEDLPGEALEMLAGIRGDDRSRVADLWLPAIARLDGSAAAKRLIKALGTLVDPENAEQRFLYNVGRLALGVRHDGLDLVEAVAQAGRLLRTSSPGGRSEAFRPFMKRALAKLLPPAPEPRAAAVVRLLLSPAVLPSIKRVIETELCAVSLERAGKGLAGVLPPVAELAARGPLLLRAAACLGARWREDPRAAEAFVREAAQNGRYDAAAAFLGAAENGRPGFLESAASEGDASLVRKMTRATDEHLAARLYLRPYAAALLRGGSLVGKRRRP
jgi:hypothetical protein